MMHQQLPRGLHVRHVIRLTLVQGGVAQQAERAQQPVQGRAHLVAHDGKEFGLGTLTGQRLVAGIHQGPFGLPTVGDIAHEGHENRLVAHGNAVDRQFDGEPLARFAPRGQLHAPRAQDVGLPGQFINLQFSLEGGFAVFRHHQRGQIGAQSLVGGVAKDRFGGGVVGPDPPLAIEHQHRVQRRFKDLVQAQGGFALFLGLVLRAPRKTQQNDRKDREDQHKADRRGSHAVKRAADGAAVVFGLTRRVQRRKARKVRELRQQRLCPCGDHRRRRNQRGIAPAFQGVKVGGQRGRILDRLRRARACRRPLCRRGRDQRVERDTGLGHARAQCLGAVRSRCIRRTQKRTQRQFCTG